MTVYNEKSKLYRYQYEREKLKRIPLDVPLEPNKASELTYDMIKTAAEKAGEPINGYIKKAILSRIESERSDTNKPDPPEKS